MIPHNGCRARGKDCHRVHLAYPAKLQQGPIFITVVVVVQMPACWAVLGHKPSHPMNVIS